MSFDDPAYNLDSMSLFDQMALLQRGFVWIATDISFSDSIYRRLRRELLDRADLQDKVPEFVRRYRDNCQFRQFIRHKYDSYDERREFIWSEFEPLLDYLEANDRSPNVAETSEALERFDADNVHHTWRKALERKTRDPEGAITAARTLLESVFKHILEDAKVEYGNDDLPKLWIKCAEELNLAPSQHQESIFKAILGNCQSIVNNVSAIRNKVGDAHGKGRHPVKPAPRHAELVVNLAGTMASFLVATWEEHVKYSIATDNQCDDN